MFFFAEQVLIKFAPAITLIYSPTLYEVRGIKTNIITVQSLVTGH